MHSISCKAVLFDLDGVLVDSTPAVTRVWSVWAAGRGFDPDEVVARAHGRPSITTIREYLPDADHEAENREVERMEIEDLKGVTPLPGALSLLSSLRDGHWAIVTSCTGPLAQVRIRAAGLPIPKVLITASDIVHGKPNPEPYLIGSSRLGVPAHDCVVIEDVPAGIRAGKAAGMRVIAFTTTVGPEELGRAGADCIVANCGDISVKQGPTGDLNLQLRDRR